MSDNKNEINKKHAKELFEEALQKYANKNLKKNFIPSKISDERIEQAFAIVDAHTRIIDQRTQLDSYNQVISTITSLLVITPEWNLNINKCKEIIDDYYSVYIDESKISDNDYEMKEFSQSIRDYITKNCLILYAVYHHDKELLIQLNNEVTQSLNGLFKVITGPIRPTTNDPIKKDTEKEKENA